MFGCRIPKSIRVLLGVVKAAAKAGAHWGIARESRNFGLRVPNQDLARFRTLLRPEDTSLNDANRTLIPSGAWVLKGVCAQATSSEISNALCTVWPVLPVKQLSVKKGRATWLIDAAQPPPASIFKAEGQILFVEPCRKETRRC